MGGAFTAVADDAFAFHWNPAGYAFGPVVQAGFHWGDSQMDRDFEIDERDGSIAADRVTGFGIGFTFMGVGTTFSRHTTSERDGDWAANRGLETFDLAVSLLYSLPLDNLVIAGNVHYLRGETFDLMEPLRSRDAYDSPAVLDRVLTGEGIASSTATVDLAALYELDRRFRVGVMWRRITEPGFETESGGEMVLPRHARAGVAFELPASALVSFDADLSTQRAGADRFRELSLGFEKGLFDGALSLRAGLRAEAGSGRGARPAFSLGAGAEIRFLLAEVAYVSSSEGRDETVWFALTVR